MSKTVMNNRCDENARSLSLSLSFSIAARVVKWRKKHIGTLFDKYQGNIQYKGLARR